MISVVIPAYNEEKRISKCLDGLSRQNTKEKFEVIVVNNKSTDNTVSIAEKYKNKLNLRIIEEPKKGRGSARYTGFANARGNIIFSIDADSVALPSWIDIFLKELKEKNVAAVTGTLTVNDINPIRNYLLNTLYIPLMVGYRLVIGHYWLSGFNFAIRKDVYDTSGGFNPKINSQEDTDLAFKVSRLGKIKLVKNNPVLFSGRRFKNGIIAGFLPYAGTFISYFWLKSQKLTLSDIR